MMLTFKMNIQSQPLEHQYQQNSAQVDNPQQATKTFAWESVEAGAAFSQHTAQRHMRASSPSSSSSPRLPGTVQCYPEQVSQPSQPTDFMGSSNGPYYGPYTSRASPTLSSPSPMTPNTEDMFHQWPGRRRPSDFATSAAPSSFSPRSPRDYDFPTGKHLPPYMDGSQRPTPGVNLFAEAFNPFPAASYPGQGPLPFDPESDLAMNGPPYPAHIIDRHGGVTYLDPHVLNTSLEGTFHAPVETDDLGIDYGLSDYQSPASDNILHPDQRHAQQNQYVDANDHDHADPKHTKTEDNLRTAKRSTVPKAPSHHAAQHRNTSQQHHGRRLSDQTRALSRPHNQCTICHKPFDSATKLRKHMRKEHIRPFPCIFAEYGCNSVFGTKNEWSRHVKVQHLRLETWRCNIDGCDKHTQDEDHPLLPPASKGKSEYDRKDLFLNHVRRCHKDRYPKLGIIEGPAAAAYEEQAQQRCHQNLRSSPQQSLCPCCPGVPWQDFDARLEHVGRAMESDEEARAGFKDELLERYLIQEGLLCQDHGRWLLTGAEGKKGGRQARRPAQKSLTTQTPLSSTAAGRHEPSVQGSRKSKRVALKRQQLTRQAKEEENSEDDAEAEADEDYAI